MRADEKETLRPPAACRSMVDRPIEQHSGRVASSRPLAPPVATERSELEDVPSAGNHSSGTPSLRRPAKYTCSYNSRIFGGPQ
jgi:hypothetical protein